MRILQPRSLTLLSVVGFSSAIVLGQAALDSLKSHLLNQPVTVNIAELRLSKLPHPEVRVVNGVVQKRMLNLKLDTDEVISQNGTVRVTRVESEADKKNDYLRVTVSTNDGATAKIAFVEPIGGLAAMDEAALEQLVAPVLGLETVGASQDSNSASSSAIQAAVQPMAAIPQPPPPQDGSSSGSTAHSATLDLPPAAPGFPPMQAKDPAPGGCRYEAYFSAKFSVEFAYPQCPDGSGQGPHVTILDGNEGPVAKNTGMADEAVLFAVYAKRPDETLQAAVRRVVIAKMKDPAARLACKAEPTPSASGQHIVQISAAGPYTKRKSYPLGKGGLPCDGFLASEDGSYDFIEFPEDSRTVFIMLPNDKGSFAFPSETIHFASVAAKLANSKENGSRGREGVPPNTTASEQKNEKIPPMQDIWLSQGRTTRDLADEASTVVSFTHGMLLGSGAGNAIMAVSCEKSRQGTPVLMLHAEIPVYQGMQQTLANKAGTVSIGNSRHDEQLTTAPGAHFLDVAAPLDQNDVAEMSATQLAGQRDISIMYFGGAGRDIAAGDLPPANAALDAVLNACNVTTPPRTAAQPERQLSPDDVAHLQLAKLSLGMSEAEAKQALGAGYRFQPGDGGRFKNLSFLLAADSSNVYGMTFFDHFLRAFTYKKSFAPGAQPLAMNLINNLTAKTWLPLVGGTASVTAWSTDASGIPITVATQTAHPNCGVVRQDSAHAPAPFAGATNVSLVDTGAKCGVTVRLQLTQGADRSMVRDMALLVVDYRPIHALVSGVQNQQQQQKADQQKKAGQVATPF